MPNIVCAASRSSSKAYLEMPYGSSGCGVSFSVKGGSSAPYTAMEEVNTNVWVWCVMAALSSAMGGEQVVAVVEVAYEVRHAFCGVCGQVIHGMEGAVSVEQVVYER